MVNFLIDVFPGFGCGRKMWQRGGLTAIPKNKKLYKIISHAVSKKTGIYENSGNGQN